MYIQYALKMLSLHALYFVIVDYYTRSPAEIKIYVWFQVRDRATLYLKQLGGEAGGPSGLGQQLDVSLVGFERQLQEYLAAGTTDRVFDVVSRQDLLGGWGVGAFLPIFSQFGIL